MTTNAWDTASRLADKHANQGGIFVRLTSNGDKIVGAFCGEPFAREVVWTGERYETYDPSVHTDKRPSLRVMLNFFVPAEGDMKVIEGGTVWFKDVLKVRDKYGLDKWLFEIERHGEADDPKTTYSILPEEKLDDEPPRSDRRRRAARPRGAVERRRQRGQGRRQAGEQAELFRCAPNAPHGAFSLQHF
jgi:hypothetical protein